MQSGSGVYYYNKITNRTSWVPNDDEDSDESDDDDENSPDIPGWVENIDSSGRRTYYNPSIKVSTLVKPKFPKEKDEIVLSKSSIFFPFRISKFTFS